MFKRRSKPAHREEIKFTADVLAVLDAAKDEALSLNQHFVGTEHLLLGIMRDPHTLVAQILAASTDYDLVRTHIRGVVDLDQTAAPTDLLITPRAQRVLHFARREADQYRMTQVAPEHVLIGIFREGEGVAMDVLMGSGVDAGRVMATITQRWRHDRDRPPES